MLKPNSILVSTEAGSMKFKLVIHVHRAENNFDIITNVLIEMPDFLYNVTVAFSFQYFPMDL